MKLPTTDNNCRSSPGPSPVPTPVPGPDIILISSTGPAADYDSRTFGYYLCAGDYGGFRYYKQLHSVDRRTGGPYFAYKTSRGWAISETLGEISMHDVWLSKLAST